MDKPLVSVVMCTYNGHAYLKDQIESILTQTYTHFELIISDDASIDGTRQILKQFENTDRVRIFYQESNLGIAANYSFVCSKAKGKFIAFSDQDDIWLPEKIEKLVASIGNSPLVYSNSQLMDQNGKLLEVKLSDWKKMYSGEDSRGYFLYSCVWGHGMLITRELLEKCLPIPKEIHHDIWIVFQAFMNGGIKYLNETLTQYRQHPPGSVHDLQFSEGKGPEAKIKAYKKKLAWLLLMKENERKKYQPFYDKLYQLYELKQHRSYVFPLMSFMLKNRKAIFNLSRKGLASQFVEILKQAKGIHMRD